MLIENLCAKRLHNNPADASSMGHKLALRGGYVHQVVQGVFTLSPLGHKVCRKIENIIREEMDGLGCQEFTMPVVSPAALWQETGRYDTVDVLAKFSGRNGQEYVLNCTHEEVTVDFVRNQINSYRQLPVALYQIQTKFRDELRARAGLIRVREFTMKDAYSFHRTQEDFDDFYNKMLEAYHRIYKRIGLDDVVDILSDSGDMGGSKAHEFMMVSDVGEDTIFLCSGCDYRANREVAKSRRYYMADEKLEEMAEVATPDMKTIEEVGNFLGKNSDRCCKAVAFMTEKGAVIAFIRGDFEVSQVKLAHVLDVEKIRPMEDFELEKLGICAGFIGPVGLENKKVKMVFDESVAKTPNLVIGANKPDTHVTGFNFSRYVIQEDYHDISEVKDGEACPKCGWQLKQTRGIEVGNIFQQDTRYTKDMNFVYNEQDGSEKHPIMGAYGIGIGRAMASVMEANNDEYGPIWPLSVAPYQVHICAMRAKDENVKKAAFELYENLKKAGIEVILDAREDVRAGSMFADADLIAAPLRLVVSPKNLEKNAIEVKTRTVKEIKNIPSEISIDEAIESVKEILENIAKTEG